MRSLFYLSLLAGLLHVASARSRRVLYQSDFQNGTFRIQTPGEYVLGEDIKFGPRPDLNWWNQIGDPKYPGGSFYLGFFAAITIETNDVVLDLNGKTLECSKPFYLLQRFFNLIELGDRVFIDFEGVSSLNYQVGDKIQFQPGATYPPLAVASRVVIRNGRLGLASHNGIHGMGARDVTIQNLVVENFEVAGIQCNGCIDVKIRNVVVGPSSRQVPATAQFSSARFLDRYTNDFIPYGFPLEPLVAPLNLLEKTITFADRPNQVYTIKKVFERLRIGVTLYQQWYFAQVGFNNTVFNVDSLNAEEKEIWRDAFRLFHNRYSLPDGSAIYGIFLNRFGASVDFFGFNDENYYGGETLNSQVQNVVIKDLALKMTTVVTLVNEAGEVIQGPARDSLRLYDMTHNQLTDFKTALYKGNFLSDAYFAFWKLSTLFYNARVFESPCGSFPSNATFPWGYWQQQCTLTRKAEAGFNGRDSAIYQKRFFGGLLISQDLYDWATINGTKLEKVLESEQHPFLLRRTRHSLVCNTDTMFHEGKGVVGFRADFSDGVRVQDITIKNLTNFGDRDTWECNLKAEFSTGEARHVESFSVEPKAHVNVRGMEFAFTRDVRLGDVDITSLNSEEGSVFGIDIKTDTNDVSDYNSGNLKYSFNDIDIKDLIGGTGAMVTPIRLDSVGMDLRQFETGAIPELHNDLKMPRVVVTTTAKFDSAASFIVSTPQANLDQIKTKSNYDTDAKVLEFRNKVLGYMENQYGLKNPVFQDNEILGSILYPENNVFGYWTIIGGEPKNLNFTANTWCFNDAALGETPYCTPARYDAGIFDSILYLIPINPGATLYGVWGGDEGKFVDVSLAPAFMVGGMYIPENVVWRGIPQDNVPVEYYSACPIIFDYSKAVTATNPTPPQAFMINCDLRSDMFGRGKAEGVAYSVPNTVTGKTDFVYTTVWTFDNTHEEQIPSGVRTTSTDIQGVRRRLTISAQANGMLRMTPAMAGNSVWSFHPSMHYQNEAGIKFLRKWLNFDDARILSMRADFSAYLLAEFGITANWATGAFIENSLDLAGTTTCFPYELNHDSNLKWINSFDNLGNTKAAPFDARIHEGGFMCRIGRMGISTSHGYLSYGALIHYGYYIIENYNGPNQDLVMRFQSEYATFRNLAKMSTVHNKVLHPTLGWGVAKGFVDEYKPAENGAMLVNQKYFFIWE